MTQLIPEGYMPFKTYKKVLHKLLTEIPLLTNIELFSWGEPFLNPDLSKIIRLTQKYVPCSVSTHLNTIAHLEEIIQSEPEQLAITINGYGHSYEKIMKGASWSLLLQNLDILNTLIKKYNPCTRVVIKAYTYQFVDVQFSKILSDLCSSFDFQLSIEPSYLNPYDQLLDYCLGKDIGSTASFVLNELSWDLTEALKLAKKDINHSCLPQRIFPIINWDLSVALCHVYYYPIIAKNYLEINWDELLRIRHKQEQCISCQKYALHRLDLDVLSKRYPNQIDKVFNK